MSLGQKALGGFFWTLTSNLGNKVIGLVIGLILARLLTPKDFGLVAMLYIFFEVSQSLVKSGFGQALIREDELTESDKSTVFYMNLIVSIICYALLWLGAPLIAKFYDNDLLVDLTQFMALSIIFQAFTIVQISSLTHELAFKKLMKINLITNLLTGVTGIILAYLGYGVWALAFKYVSQSFIMTVALYILNPWYPKKFIVKESLKRLFGFGSKLFLSGLINTIYSNVYKLIIGKFFNASLLGLFTHAQMYVKNVTESAVGTLQTVTYPILSKAKNDELILRRAYGRIITSTSYIIFPLVIGLGLLAEPLILTLVGEQWIESVPFLQILCVSGGLYHLHAVNLNILQVLGRSDIFLKLEIIKKINISIAIIIGLQFGIWGLMIGQVISSYVALFINMYYTKKFINYTYKEQFRDILPIIAYTIPMVLLIIVFLKMTALPAIINLAIGILIGCSSYLLLTYYSKCKALKTIIELLAQRFSFFNRLNI